MMRLEAPPSVRSASLEQYFSSWLHGKETQLSLTTAGQVGRLLTRQLALNDGQDVMAALESQKQSAIITYADQENNSIRGQTLAAIQTDGSVKLKTTGTKEPVVLSADTQVILYLSKAPSTFFEKEDNLQSNSI